MRRGPSRRQPAASAVTIDPVPTRRSGVSGRILREAMAYIDKHGLVTFRLRPFAESIGTTHRMVIHYFGGKDRLLAAVFREMRRNDIETIRRESRSVRMCGQAIFEYYTSPENALRVRIFFDLFGTAIQQPEAYTDFLGSLADWVDLLIDLAVAEGYPKPQATVRARALMAGIRGLLIELYAHDNRRACEATFRWLLGSTFPAKGTE